MTEANPDPLIAQLLDQVEASCAQRPEFEPAISRDKASEILRRVLDLYAARLGSSASIYAVVALEDAIGFKSTAG